MGTYIQNFWTNLEKNNNQKVDIILYTKITMFNAYIYLIWTGRFFF